MSIGAVDASGQIAPAERIRQRAARDYGVLREYLSEPISPLSIAVFRIAFGALLLWDVIRYAQKGWIQSKYGQPEFLFAYDGFGWLPVASPFVMDLIWIGVGLSAFFILIGASYRLAMATFIGGYGYFFLLDKAQYMNHHYMVLLFALIMLAVPADAALSVRARSGPRPTMRLFHKVLLAVQIEIILVMAGLVKITPDWLGGAPLDMWLRAAQDEVFYGWLFQYDAVILLASWGVVALHVLGAPLLLWRRTRLPVFIVYCLFHLSNAQLFQIGIFPLLTIGASTLLFAPNWPVQLWRFVRGGWRGSGSAPVRPAPAAPLADNEKLPHLLIACAFGWMLVQAALPWRHVLYDNDVAWAGQGHRYSWRMKIYDRDAYGHFIVTDAETRAITEHPPEDFFTPRQTRKLLTRPDMIIDAAHHIRDTYANAGRQVEVRAVIHKSLNGRPHQLYVDPDIDLAKARHVFWAETDILLNPRP